MKDSFHDQIDGDTNLKPDGLHEGSYIEDLRIIPDDDLLRSLKHLVARERKLCCEILSFINEVERRRLFAELGYSSCFDWLTKDIGYSGPAAYRRIQAARLMRAVPSASSKVASGELNLTTLAKAQSMIRTEEKRSGIKMLADEKAHAVSRIENCTVAESESRLATLFPEAHLEQTRREVIRTVDEHHVRAHVTLTKVQMRKLERVREVLSHRNFGASLAETIEAAADELLDRRDHLRRKIKKRTPKRVTLSRGKRGLTVDAGDAGAPSPNLSQGETATVAQSVLQKVAYASVYEASRTRQSEIPLATRNEIFRRDRGRCQFVDDRTGHVCHAQYQVQIDHVVPRALGGDNSKENLRLLCRTHNLLMAERSFGKELIARYRVGPQEGGPV